MKQTAALLCALFLTGAPVQAQPFHAPTIDRTHQGLISHVSQTSNGLSIRFEQPRLQIAKPDTPESHFLNQDFRPESHHLLANPYLIPIQAGPLDPGGFGRSGETGVYAGYGWSWGSLLPLHGGGLGLGIQGGDPFLWGW